jgi:hypothetical protein
MADLLDFMLMFKRATADYEAKIMEALVEMMKEDVGKEAAEAEEAEENEETEEAEEEEAEAEEEEEDEDDQNMYVSKPNTVYIELLLKNTPSRPRIEKAFRSKPYYESQEQFVLDGCERVIKQMGYKPEQATKFITKAINDHIEQQSKFLYEQRKTGAHVCIENYDKLLAELEYLRMKYRSNA